ncbi:MAG: hypothetical protein V4543_10130 [Bacteroidota bacterium]
MPKRSMFTFNSAADMRVSFLRSRTKISVSFTSFGKATFTPPICTSDFIFPLSQAVALPVIHV